MQLTGATVAVTGATGFLGRYVVDVLLARGARVVGVVRNPDRVPELRARGVELRRADLAEPARLAEGFAGADAAVSNAALLSLRNRRWEDHQSANVEGAANVFDALAAAGVRRVVQVSSVAVYRGCGSRLGEDAPRLGPDTPRTRLNAYALSKALAEEVAWRKAAEHGLALTCVRPCAIYGAFDPTFTAIFRRLVRLPLSLVPAGSNLPLVYAGDVAEAIALALERPAAIGRAYNVAGEDGTLWEFWRAWRAAGGPHGLFALPVPVPFTRRYDSSRARAELGWRTRPVIEALAETFAREGRA